MFRRDKTPSSGLYVSRGFHSTAGSDFLTLFFQIANNFQSWVKRT